MFKSNMFFYAQLRTREYFAPRSFSEKGFFVFPCFLSLTTDKVEHPWGISSHGEFLCVLGPIFPILLSTRRSPTCKNRGLVRV